ncbi:hypothetical protein D3C87_1810060 [compost metagenome]
MGVTVMPVIGIIGDKADPVRLDPGPLQGGHGLKRIIVIVKKSRDYGHLKLLLYLVS